MSTGKNILVALALSPFSGALRAAVFAKGWEWFVADEFGLPHLSLLQAWGISFLAAFVVVFPHHHDGAKPRDALEVWFESLILSALTFLSLLVLVQFR